MANATGAVSATYHVTYTVGVGGGVRAGTVALIEDYTTFADIPKILATRYGVDISAIDILIAEKED